MFSPDGDLYIGVGDGGGAGDLPNNAQNLGKDLGKILRVYTTPGVGSGWVNASGQPFSGALPEIWAYGLRNPWRFSFDPATGTLVIGDVGQDSWEEVDALPAGTAPGLNLGWHYCEGTYAYPSGNPSTACTTTYAPPVFEYPHTLGRCSITGGVVVRDPALTALDGRYIYGDFCGGDIHSFTVPAPGQGAGDDAATGLHVDGLDSFGVDGLGHVYAVSLNGPVYRLDSPGERPRRRPAEAVVEGAAARPAGRTRCPSSSPPCPAGSSEPCCAAASSSTRLRPRPPGARRRSTSRPVRRGDWGSTCTRGPSSAGSPASPWSSPRRARGP